MKIKILLVSIVLCISMLLADAIDYTNWKISIEVKDDPTAVIDLHSKLESTAKSMIKNILFDANQTVEDYLVANGKLSRQFDRLNLKLKQSDIRYLSDGSTIYQYEVPLTGSIMNLIFPGAGTATPLAILCCPLCGRPWPENLAVPDGVKLIPMESELTPQYTGVLIDTRDITLNPCLFPKIFTDDGKEVYSLNFADSNYVFTKGLVAYVNSYADAYQNERLGINPLRITALKSTGDNKTDIIISSFNAKSMHSSQHNLRLLENCQVVILTSE